MPPLYHLYQRQAIPAAAAGQLKGKRGVPPTIPGWTVKCVGDDIAWMHVGEDGRLYAINPESGFFGVAPGTSNVSNLSAMVCSMLCWDTRHCRWHYSG